MFQCRTQHFMWCNKLERFLVRVLIVSMPHAAFYVVQPRLRPPQRNDWCFNAARSILCGATESGVIRISSNTVSMPHAAFYVVQRRQRGWIVCCARSFNAARSILCGATAPLLEFLIRSAVSMPHAAFYVVQRATLSAQAVRRCFNAARSILCGATFETRRHYPRLQFQCRTQHFMWCNSDGICKEMGWGPVSMPHAAFYVVQQQSVYRKRRW